MESGAAAVLFVNPAEYTVGSRPIAVGVAKVNRLQGLSFEWKGSGKHDIGLVAEDVAH